MNLMNFQIFILASFICLVTFILAHIRHAPTLNMKNMIFLKATNIIMPVTIVMIMHKRKWVLAMMRFMKTIMTLSHFQSLPYVSHSWYYSSLILVIMANKALVKGFLILFQFFSRGLDYDVSYFPILLLSQSSGLWKVHIKWWWHQWWILLFKSLV